MIGRLLGIDFGTVRIGLAVTDPDRILASPLETFERKEPATEEAWFRRLMQEEKIVGIVIGLPVHNDGREGKMAEQVRAFGTWLQTITQLPICYWDERFTSVHASESLWEAGLTHKKRKQRVDRVAAQMLLQSYLEAGCPEG
jgi:putative Holliday junction resolvase